MYGEKWNRPLRVLADTPGVNSPLSSAFITPSLQLTSQQHPVSHFVTIEHSLLHTTIWQTSHISNQWMCRSHGWVIGLTNCWHCTASTRSGRVHFHHVWPIYLNGVLPLVVHSSWTTLILLRITVQLYHKFTTLLSIHNSFTPSNVPTDPLSHFATIPHPLLHNHPTNFQHCQPADVLFLKLRDWIYQLLTLHS